ncbi:hypothetical protein JM80_2858 [Cellulophaga sp. RHA_52]|nr:hypothetical protein JM80_2858 [Cellulophaga sp. RHA_52]
MTSLCLKESKMKKSLVGKNKTPFTRTLYENEKFILTNYTANVLPKSSFINYML